MKISVKYINDAAIIEVAGKININSAKLIETVGSLSDSGIRKIIIDIQNVDFIDYNGLSVLAIAYKSILHRKGIMKLSGVSLHILELLRIVKLDDVFEIYNNVKDALASFKEAERMTKTELLKKPLRRRFRRLDMDIPVCYRLGQRLSRKGGGELYTGRMANISGAGIFIRTINILPPGSEVNIEISLRRHEKPKSLKGRVLWVADQDLQPELYPGMGVEFTGLPPQAQEEIIEFIEENIVHRRG